MEKQRKKVQLDLATSKFNEKELDRLSIHLGLSETNPELTARLQDAAEAFGFGSLVDRDPTRSERRKNLTEIAELANDLAEALSNLESPKKAVQNS